MKFLFFATCIILSYSVVCQTRDYEEIPKKIAKSPELLAAYLSRNTRSQEQQVTKIYEYITSEIAYDYSALTASKPYDNNSSEKTLKSKLAIGFGYCYLMNTMLTALDINSVVVSGYSHGSLIDSLVVPYQNSSYWIAIQIDDEWKLADPMMDAGYIGKEENNNERKLIEKREKTIEKFDTKNIKLQQKRDQLVVPKKTNKMDKKIRGKEKSHQKKLDEIDTELKEADFYKNSIGFVQDPGKDYFLVHVDSFLVTHLPLNPMWQLRKDTISIIDFAKGEEHIKTRLENDQKGNYNFGDSISNYTSLHEIDQLIWAANDGNAYNTINAHAVTTNYHTYLRILFTNNFKTTYQSLNFDELNEVLYKIDTTLTSNKVANKTENNGYKFSKKYFGSKFKEAKKGNKMYTSAAKSLSSKHEKFLEKLEKNLDKGDDDIEKLEKKVYRLKVGAKEINPLDETYSVSFKPFKTELDSMQVLNKMFLNQFKGWKNALDSSYLQDLANNYSHNSFLLKQRSYFVGLNNYNLNYLIDQVDSIYAENHEIILTLYNDSLAIEMLDGLDKILKLQSQLTTVVKIAATELATKDKSYDSKAILSYFNFHLHKNYNSFYESKSRSLDHNAWMLDILKGFTKYVKEIQDESEEQADLVEERNEYSLEMLENEHSRIIHIYDAIKKNATSWKKMTETKIDEKKN